MKKIKLLLLLLLPFWAIGQVSTGQETPFDYGIQNLSSQTIATPINIVTQGTDGTQGKAVYSTLPLTGTASTALGNKADKTNGVTQITDPNAHAVLATGINASQSTINTAIDAKVGANSTAITLKEDIANKQNNLAIYDGTGVKYVGKDGFDTWGRNVATVATKTGLLSKLDTFDLTAFSTTVARIGAVQSCMFWNELFVANTSPSSAIKSFAQKDYTLTQLITATGGNVNVNPLTADGKYIRYLGYDKNGNVYSSGTAFVSNNDIFQIGFVTVVKSGSAVTFLDGTTAGGRNVFPQPNLASNTDFDKVTSPITNVTVAANSGASLSTSSGSITGISLNWKSTTNTSNGNPIDVFNYTGIATVPFAAIDPTFLNSTAAITPHTVWTDTDSGIPINQTFYNTTTGARGTMANSSASVARVLIGVRGGVYVQFGEFATTACYSDLTSAKNNLYNHVFSEAFIPGVTFEIARIAYTKSASVFTNDSQFYIGPPKGSAGAGGVGGGAVADATTATKGIVKLAGDFGGTADLPTVPGLNSKANSALTINTISPLSGGGDLSSNRTFSISQSTTSTDGYLSSTDWNTFNSKQSALTNPITGSGTQNWIPKIDDATGKHLGNSSIFDNGFVSIGTTNNLDAALSVSSSTGGQIGFGTDGFKEWSFGESVGDGTKNFQFYNYNTGSVNMSINRATGNVLIETKTDNGSKLRVNGSGYFDDGITSGNTLSVGGPVNSAIQFLNGASSDIFLGVREGTRTVEIRNGNYGSPNFNACELKTGHGTFTADLGVGGTGNFGGIVNCATPTAGDNSTKAATTAFVTTANSSKANLSSPTFTGTPTAPTATAGTNTDQVATTAFVQTNSRPYKVYTALLTQIGAGNAPVATVLENTLGFIPTFAYISVGNYRVVSSAGFTAGKAVAFLSSGFYNGNTASIRDGGASAFNILSTNTSGAFTDGGALTNNSIEIRVYN